MAIDRPEDEILLCCARVREEPEKSYRLRELLREDLDWAYLLYAASKHAVTPLLFWHLNAVCPEAVPVNVLDQLRDDFHDNTEYNLFLTRELLEIVERFGAHGIPTVPFKGPTLAALAYGNLALREFIDLDVLVRKQDVPAARELLFSLGYRQDEPTHEQEAAFFRSQREYVFARDDGYYESVVELHWAVTARNFSFPLDYERLWERLDELSLGGGRVLSFSPEDLLLILCVHGSKHFWFRLAWICDVAELIRDHDALDWEWIVSQASALGSERMLFLGLFLANDLLEAPLPKEILRKMQADPELETLAGQVREWLFQVDEAAGIWAKGQREESSFHPFRLKMRERLRDKIRYSVYTALAPAPEDWDFLPLPKPLYPLYYVLRPVRMTGRYGRRLLGRHS